jgi:hypothetical protein
MKTKDLRPILDSLKEAGVAEFSGLGIHVRFCDPGESVPEDISSLSPEQLEDRRIRIAEAKRKHDQQLENWSVG